MTSRVPPGNRARHLLRENGLTIVLALLFLASLAGHALFGWRAHDVAAQVGGEPRERFVQYLASGDFLGSLGENWESEFLQMLVFVYLSTFLVQRGSPESKSPDEAHESDEDPRTAKLDARTPWPVRRGGIALALYGHSLGLAFLALFLVSFVLHAAGSARHYREATGVDVSLLPCRFIAILVRVVPELAERVPVDRRARAAHRVPATARLAAVEARGGAARGAGPRTTPTHALASRRCGESAVVSHSLARTG